MKFSEILPVCLFGILSNRVQCASNYIESCQHLYDHEATCVKIGDMIIVKYHDEEIRSGFLHRGWPSGEIPFDFHDSVLEDNLKFTTIKRAIKRLNKNSCVKFRPRTNKDVHGIRFFNSSKSVVECSSIVGYRPNKVGYQYVNIGDKCSKLHSNSTNNTFTTVGTVMHELIHSLGFYHEHSRDDRDSYVKIVWENIAEHNINQFQKASVYAEGEKLSYFGQPYNFESIMHYSAYSRALVPGTKTIIALNTSDAVGNPDKMGHESYLTKPDISMINIKYYCNNNCATDVELEIDCKTIN